MWSQYRKLKLALICAFTFCRKKMRRIDTGRKMGAEIGALNARVALSLDGRSTNAGINMSDHKPFALLTLHE